MFAWSEVCGERPAVMGIVNVTPDSFSDGGQFVDADAAVDHALQLAATLLYFPFRQPPDFRSVPGDLV